MGSFNKSAIFAPVSGLRFAIWLLIVGVRNSSDPIHLFDHPISDDDCFFELLSHRGAGCQALR